MSKYDREKSTGSIFDFAEQRSDIVKSIRNPHIDDRNRKIIPLEILEPADQILAALKSYRGAATPAQLKRQLSVLKRNRSFKAKRKSPSLVGETKSAPVGTAPPAVSFREALKALGAAVHPRPQAKAKTKTKAAKKSAKSARLRNSCEQNAAYVVCMEPAGSLEGLQPDTNNRGF
jgi:hypothetical protein